MRKLVLSACLPALLAGTALAGEPGGRAALGVPAINSGGVVSASAFGEFTLVSPGSWIEIYGTNLATKTRPWQTSDFNGINAPIELSGTSVAVGGQAAYVEYISPNQVNALISSNVATGTQMVSVKSPGGTSASVSVTVNAVSPGLLAPPSFNIGGTQYAVALFPDGSFVLPTGAIPGLNSRPAMPGDTIVLYGVGFGPVTSGIPAGQLAQQDSTLSYTFNLYLAQQLCSEIYAGLAPFYTGLYQFDIIVPMVPAGNAALTFNVNGTDGTQTLYIAVQN